MKVGMAVIGCGRIGQVHLRSIAKLSNLANLVAVVDSCEEIAIKSANKFSAKRWYSSIDVALEDEEISAVVVALPHLFHKDVTIKAAKAGKHILVEKPLALNLAQTDAMIEACESARVILMAGQSRRYFQALQHAKTQLENLGPPFSLNYIWAVYAEEGKAPEWWRSKDLTGGLIIPMLGSHTIDYTLWMFEPRRPVNVYARAYSNHNYFEGDDEAIIFITFDDGSMAVNHLSHNVKPRVHQGLIVCPHGNIVFKHDHLPHQPVGVDSISLWINGNLCMEGEQEPDNMVLEMKEFLDSILQKRLPLTSANAIRGGISIVEAAELSAKERKIISIVQ